MSRNRIRDMAAGFILCALLSATVLTAASGGVTREVFYDVNIVVNGTAWNPPADMTPFISEGRTFLPVRGIAELLDVPVDWDGATRTVFVGTIPHGAPLMQIVPPFEQSGMTTRASVSISGNNFADAIVTSHQSAEAWQTHNLNAQFSSISGTIGRIDGSWHGSTSISFIGDGRTLAIFEVGANDSPRDISVDVSGVIQLRIQVSQYVNSNIGPNFGRAALLAFANAMIY